MPSALSGVAVGAAAALRGMALCCQNRGLLDLTHPLGHQMSSVFPYNLTLYCVP